MKVSKNTIVSVSYQLFCGDEGEKEELMEQTKKSQPYKFTCGSGTELEKFEENLMGKSVGRSIIGTGININQTVFPEGLAAPPTSLRRHIDREVSPASLVRSVAEVFSRYYAEIKEGCYDNIRELYHRHLYLRGRVARFRDEAGIFSGTISHVEPDGHLIVIDDSSVSRRYAFKQVQLIRDDRIL